VQVIRALGRKRSGVTREQLRASTGPSTGGYLTTVLLELENTGFVLRSARRQSVRLLQTSVVLRSFRENAARCTVADRQGRMPRL
jgi:hypothetical protein